MSELKILLAERERYWQDHPIITETAVLPTRPVRDAVARVMRLTRKARASIAWWAPPVTGKSTCIKAIRDELERRFQGAGIVEIEAVEDKSKPPSEGRLLITILDAIDFAPKIARDIADKRVQVKRALIALSGTPKRIFFFVDEAQDLSLQEFAWLKAVINGVYKKGIKITTIIFGQVELCKRRGELIKNGRSDLAVRFMKIFLEFRGCRVERDFRVICLALDNESEYPRHSGWNYTKFLFPEAYQSEFRFAKVAAAIWERFVVLIPPVVLKKGLPMDVIAGFFGHLCSTYKNTDVPDLKFDEKMIDAAINAGMAG